VGNIVQHRVTGRLGLTAAVIVSAVTVTGLLASPAQAAASSGKTELISKSADGNAASGESQYPTVTPDGRYVAFQSLAGNLTAQPDTLGEWDVFVRDTKTGKTTKISTGLKGAEADGTSVRPDITPDGRYVAFISTAGNLVKGDTTDLATEVFVKDRKTGKTTRIFSTPRGPEEYGGMYDPSISADGTTVAFSSNRADLVKGDTNGDSDVFVWKRASGKITRVSVSSSGAEAGTGPYVPYGGSDHPQITANGKTVVFQSGAADLVKGDTNNLSDIFAHSLTTGKTTRISVGPKGQQATGGVASVRQGPNAPSVSADGKIVAYSGFALKGLVKADTGESNQIFVLNRSTGKTTLAVKTFDGNVVADNLQSGAISPDGRFVAFDTNSSQIVRGDTGNQDVFVRDLKKARTARASVGLKGQEANAWSGSTSIALSSGGKAAVFASDATNLVTGPVSGNDDLYLYRFAKNFWAR
jgi:Tol biopolymer transport system component